ncbi:helix-turn-helix domain-containing protein [Zunongwangia profunda]|uniref:helix-turn-helix domain-containing protein n=1 Tax=Zunongwangia profunda TaxID=398743 RepID=UPI00248E1935|nr:helix-turn-helix domain-containing protein [Zunongwangia profunda]
MENITQVHGITKEELFSKLQHIEEKLNLLSKTAQKPKKYSVKELAEHCDVAELTVRNWISEGKIKAERLGRRIFIAENEFQRALTEVKSLKYQRA